MIDVIRRGELGSEAKKKTLVQPTVFHYFLTMMILAKRIKIYPHICNTNGFEYVKEINTIYFRIGIKKLYCTV